MCRNVEADDPFQSDLCGGWCGALLRCQYAGSGSAHSTFALNNATLPFTLQLADKGWRQALKDDIHLRNGLNVCDGKITCKPVAEAHGLGFTPAETFID